MQIHETCLRFVLNENARCEATKAKWVIVTHICLSKVSIVKKNHSKYSRMEPLEIFYHLASFFSVHWLRFKLTAPKNTSARFTTNTYISFSFYSSFSGFKMNKTNFFYSFCVAVRSLFSGFFVCLAPRSYEFALIKLETLVHCHNIKARLKRTQINVCEK